jgi:hypothetical protein
VSFFHRNHDSCSVVTFSEPPKKLRPHEHMLEVDYLYDDRLHSLAPS